LFVDFYFLGSYHVDRAGKAEQLRLLHSFMDETYRERQAELEVHEEKARKKRESAFMLGIDIEKLCRQGQIDYALDFSRPRINVCPPLLSETRRIKNGLPCGPSLPVSCKPCRS
jgi:hypothetical protein